jgi:hypothetical protein
MKPDVNAMKLALKKRETELLKLIRQMKDDKIDQGRVYRNLEDELNNVKSRMQNEQSTNN